MYDRFFHSETNAATRTNVSALILRLGLALIFLFHGLDKIVKDGGAGWVNDMFVRAQTETLPTPEKTQAPQPPTSLTFMGTQLAVAWGEFLGGLALLAGILTRWAALGLVIIQVGAVALVTAPRGFRFDKGGGYEYNLVLIAMCLALLILGPGRWSVDWMLRHRLAVGARSATAPAPMPLAGPHTAVEQPAEHGVMS
jgi:putative oxidoreductase